MGNTNVTNALIHPSQSDVNGGVANDGKRLLEKYIREWHTALNAISYVISGGLLPSSAANRDLVIPAGAALISGYYVTWPQTTILNLTASNTSHIFVKITFATGLASGVQFEDNTSGTHPADSVKLGTVVTSASAITSSTDQRLLDGNQRIRRAVISATGTTNWIVPSNVTRIRIRQWGAGGGGGGGGGSDSAGYSGGDASPGHRGAYLEAVVSVTPGATVTVVNGTGGPGGAGGAGSGGGTGGTGSSGTGGGTSTVSGTGFSFTANGGSGGPGGSGAVGATGSPALWRYQAATATASSGTLDVAIDGGGNGPGQGGDGAAPTGGSPSTGAAGTAGKHAVTVIDY